MTKIKEFIDKNIKSKIRRIFRNSEFSFIKNSKTELIVEAEQFKIIFNWEILNKNIKLKLEDLYEIWRAKGNGC